MPNYDLIILRMVNGLANRVNIIDSLGIFLANYLPYLLIVLIFIILFLNKKDRLKNIATIIIAFFSAAISRWGVKDFILFFYDRPRPYVALDSVHKLIATKLTENFQSFPSGHALFFFALSAVVYFYHKKWGLFFLSASTLMGIARIFAGVHWPSDIIAGAILGVFVAYIMQNLYLRFQDKIDAFLSSIFHYLR